MFSFNLYRIVNVLNISDEVPTFVVPTKGFDHRFIIGQRTSAVYLFWPYDITDNYFAECLIATLDYNCQGNILNDARADACGRLWTGECFFLRTSHCFVVFHKDSQHLKISL